MARRLFPDTRKTGCPPIAAALKPHLFRQLDGRRAQYERDRTLNMHEMELPENLANKYPMHPMSGAGSSCSLHPTPPLIRKAGPGDVIIFMTSECNVR